MKRDHPISPKKVFLIRTILFEKMPKAYSEVIVCVVKEAILGVAYYLLLTRLIVQSNFKKIKILEFEIYLQYSKIILSEIITFIKTKIYSNYSKP